MTETEIAPFEVGIEVTVTVTGKVISHRSAGGGLVLEYLHDGCATRVVLNTGSDAVHAVQAPAPSAEEVARRARWDDILDRAVPHTARVTANERGLLHDQSVMTVNGRSTQVPPEGPNRLDQALASLGYRVTDAGGWMLVNGCYEHEVRRIPAEAEGAQS